MTFLKYADTCPKCGHPEMYEGNGETCRGCRRDFRAGDAVYLDNVPGELVEITWTEAENHMSVASCDCDCGCIHCDDEDRFDDDDVEEMVETKLWFVAYKDKGDDGHVRRKSTIDREAPPLSLVHDVMWEPPPIGPGHPLYEETLDILRKLNGARKRRSFHLSQIAKTDREMELAWQEVRPALNRLLEAKERECRSTTSDVTASQDTSSGGQETPETAADPPT